MALDMLDELAEWGMRPPLLTADAGHGQVAAFRQGLTERGIPYIVATTSLTTAQLGDAQPVEVPYAKGHARHAGKADFGTACATCPLRGQCTDSKTGRSITIGHHEARLTAARTRQQHPAWQADYRATRPKVERKIAHLMRRRHGGRRARMRGRHRIAADFTLLAAAVNLARLATLGLTHTIHGWTLNPA